MPRAFVMKARTLRRATRMTEEMIMRAMLRFLSTPPWDLRSSWAMVAVFRLGDGGEDKSMSMSMSRTTTWRGWTSTQHMFTQRAEKK